MTQNVTLHSTHSTKALIDFLFVRLAGMYGYSWTSMHPDSASWEVMKDTWAFHIKNYSADVLAKAMEDLVNLGEEFPPNLIKFVKLCNKHSGIPSEDECYKAALKRDFELSLTQQCFDKIGDWKFKTSNEKDLRKDFHEVYIEEIANFYRNHGKEKSIEHDEPTYTEEKKNFEGIKTQMPDDLRELTKKMEEKALLYRKKK